MCKAQTPLGIDPYAHVIRPAMGDAVGHSCQDILRGALRSDFKITSNSAHKFSRQPMQS